MCLQAKSPVSKHKLYYYSLSLLLGFVFSNGVTQLIIVSSTYNKYWFKYVSLDIAFHTFISTLSYLCESPNYCIEHVHNYFRSASQLCLEWIVRDLDVFRGIVKDHRAAVATNDTLSDWPKLKYIKCCLFWWQLSLTITSGLSMRTPRITS